MFNDDITPEAVNALAAELYSMLAVEDAASAFTERGPVVRVQAVGASRAFELERAGEFVFIDSIAKQGPAYTFERQAFVDALSALARGEHAVELVEDAAEDDNSPRVLAVQLIGDVLVFAQPASSFAVNAKAFLKAAGKANIGASA